MKKQRSSNKRNLLYFEAQTMRALYSAMDVWQVKNKKRLLSMSIQREGELFCCIALSNPSEVFIMDGTYEKNAVYVHDGSMRVHISD